MSKEIHVLSADGYTRIMMKHSTVPEIATLANEEMAIDDYWNDTSDNIEIISEQNINSTTEDRSISNNDENKGEKLKLHLLRFAMESDKQISRISPNLTYDVFTFPKADFEKDSLIQKSDVSLNENANDENNLKKSSATDKDELESSPTGFQRQLQI